MQDIYDRAKWPPPENNPLIQLLHREDEWVANRELVAALGLSGRRSLASSSGSNLLLRLAEGDTRVVERGLMFTRPLAMGKPAGGVERVFNRRALILLAMNVQTINAAAFRDWIADSVAGEVTDAQA